MPRGSGEPNTACGALVLPLRPMVQSGDSHGAIGAGTLGHRESEPTRMPDRRSDLSAFKSAESLAFAPELQAFCDAQLQFIDGTLDESTMRDRAILVAREARRRRLTPEALLLAMELGGCYRSHMVRDNPERSSRYFSTLHYLLSTFYDSAARPADRRLAPRDGGASTGNRPATN